MIPRILNLCSRSTRLLTFTYLAVVILEKGQHSWLSPGMVKTRCYEKLCSAGNQTRHSLAVQSAAHCVHNLQYLDFGIYGAEMRTF